MRSVGRAMAESLYGPRGFYRRLAPRAGFSTSVTSSPLLAEAIGELARRVAGRLGDDDVAVVDVGSGDGTLLAAIALVAPPAWRLVGVDVRRRPDGLPARVEWRQPPSAWWVADVPQPAGPELAGLRGLVIAHELLDDVPVGVHRHDPGGWLELAEDGTALGPSPESAARWLDRWCGVAERDVDDGVATEAESGERRDVLWAALVGSLAAGVALAVDYPVPAGEVGGTLRGYAGGRLVPVRFDGEVQVTAGVRMDALAAAGAAAGAGSTLVLDQRDALPRLGLTGPTARGRGSVADLAGASELAHLRDPQGLGSHRWLAQAVGLDVGSVLG